MPTFAADISPLRNSAQQQASINQVLLARELRDVDIRSRRGQDIFNSFVNSFNTGVKRREVESDASMAAKRGRQNFGLQVGSSLVGAGVGAGIGGIAGSLGGLTGADLSTSILTGAAAGSGIGAGRGIPASALQLGSQTLRNPITPFNTGLGGDVPTTTIGGIPADTPAGFTFPLKSSENNLRLAPSAAQNLGESIDNLQSLSDVSEEELKGEIRKLNTKLEDKALSFEEFQRMVDLKLELRDRDLDRDL